MTARSWTLCAALCNAGLVCLSLVPDRGPGSIGRKILFAGPQLQNLLHLPVFGVLAWLWMKALAAHGSRRPALMGALVTIVYGAIDEAIQYHVPGRFASVTDFLMDAAGAGVAAFVFTRRKT